MLFSPDQKDDEESFFITVNGWTGSSVQVFRSDRDTLVECAHSLIQPQDGLQGATGGILVGQHQGAVHIVVCGGALAMAEGGSKVENTDCYKLNVDSETAKPPVVGMLNLGMLGTASLVLDNGTSLWITGGRDVNGFLVDTSDYLVFSTEDNAETTVPMLLHEPGPDLKHSCSRFIGQHHCLVQVGPEVAFLIGGLIPLDGLDEVFSKSPFCKVFAILNKHP